MTAARLECLHEHLPQLRLFKSRERLEALQDATTKDLGPSGDGLTVLAHELVERFSPLVEWSERWARLRHGRGRSTRP